MTIMLKKFIPLAMLLFIVGAQVVFAKGDDITPVSYGDALSGKITDPDNGVLYSFDGAAGDEITIQASSSKIDTYLRLGNENGDILAENDDASDDTTDAEITYTLEDNATYYFAVIGYSKGSYNVSLDASSADNGDSGDVQAISYGDTVSGEAIDMDNPVIYAFEGIKGQQVSIVAASDEVDTYLIVVDADANVVAENDNTNKKNSDASVQFALPSSGTFLIGVLADQAGAFELTLESAKIGSNNGDTSNVSDEQPLGDVYTGTVDDDTVFSKITLEDVPAGATITVDVRATSGDLDPYAGVMFNDDVVYENDDRSRSDSNPIIDYKVKKAGTYTIIITRAGFDDGDTSGDFEATVNISDVSKTVIFNQVAFDTDGDRVIDKPVFRGFSNAAPGENPLLAGVDSPAAVQQ
jgi:hypothetical protein